MKSRKSKCYALLFKGQEEVSFIYLSGASITSFQERHVPSNQLINAHTDTPSLLL